MGFLGPGSPARQPTPGICPRADSTGRYLVNAFTGKPILVFGDTAWEIFNQLDLTEVRQYLDDRQSRGINAIITQCTNPVLYPGMTYAPGAKGAGNAFPFLLNVSGGAWTGVFANHDAAFDSPNATYWDWVEVVYAEANKRGIFLVDDYMYMGFADGVDDGWWQNILQTHNTQSVCYNFGLYLGNRLKKFPNHIIDAGTDMFPTPSSEGEARFKQMMQGMIDSGCYCLRTAHWKRSSNATDEVAFNSLITFNSIYPSAGGGTYAPNTARSRNAYSYTPATPAAVVEDKYEDAPFGWSRLQIRQLGWWGVLSCIGGRFFGNEHIWLFDSSWQASLNSICMQDWQQVNVFMTAREWWKLVPNGLGSIGTLVTAGGGTPQTLGTVGTNDGTNGLDYVTAAATPDGALLVAYVPDAHTGSVTIDMTKMRGTTLCKWVDPTNVTIQGTIGSFANTGTLAFSTPGLNAAGAGDWILLFTA